MTDQSGRPPEERLPVPRPEPTVPASADRFSAPPSAHRLSLTPERAAGIVRQSASARWVGFLAITVVALFVIGYYFYELGLPGGLSKPRLTAEEEQQAVTAVERGYNIYQANCARCHGVNGEGGIGPVLNRQDKLSAHLSEAYLRNILEAGGRYACGDPNSIMPIWSDTGDPAGPLNYKQIEDLIAFIRSDAAHEYEILDPELFEPILGPDGEPLTFKGWVDKDFRLAADATPYPDCWTDEFAQPSSSAAPTASGATPAPTGGGGPVITITAQGIKFDLAEIEVPADTPFQIQFVNNDAGIPHDVDIRDGSGSVLDDNEIVSGVATVTYDVPALPAGEYVFICSVHPNMTGTLAAG